MHSAAHGALRRTPNDVATPFLMDAYTPSQSDLHGILLLDCRGTVRFCNHDGRRLLGGGTDFLGGPITALLPELRLKPATPGYNVAYALFHFPSQGWYPVRAISGEGQFLSLELSVSVLRVENKYQLLLALRPRSA